MSTHVTSCIVCGKNCYCCSETHALGCGGSGCIYPEETASSPVIEFCSEKCFHNLEERMKERWKIYQEIERRERQPLNAALIEASERFAATFEEMKERE